MVADDQAVVRDGLVLLLSASEDVEVVGAAADGEEAVALVLARARRRPAGPADAALDRGPGDGRARREAPQVRVLILTTFADDDAILPALRAGAVGYLTKDATSEQLLGAIRDVAAGRTVLDPSVQRRLVELVAAPEPRRRADLGGLTKREVDVVRLVAEGLSNQQIARRLVVSEATVKTHLNHVLSKLDVDGRPGLVAWAWRQGLVGGVPGGDELVAVRSWRTRRPRATSTSVRVSTSASAMSTRAAVQASPVVMWCAWLNRPRSAAPRGWPTPGRRSASPCLPPRHRRDPAGLDERVAPAVVASRVVSALSRPSPTPTDVSSATRVRSLPAVGMSRR